MHVIVLDGDKSTPVRGAEVRVGSRAGRTGRDGVAKIRIARHARLPVTVAKRGYDAYDQRLQFRGKPKVGVRVFQSKLQWLRYGATPGRTQAHPFIRVRPPFRVVWSRAVGGLMEFPAAVSDDVAFVSNYHGSVRAYSMRNGAKIWRRDTAGKMAASPAIAGEVLVAHGMDGRVYVLNRHNGRVLWTYDVGAPIESSPLVLDGVDYFGAWNGTVYALDLATHKARWTYGSGYKITSSAAFANGTIYIGDYGGRLLALSARDRRPALVGLGQRPHLRHPGGGERPGVRDLLDRRLPDRVLDRGARLWSLGTGSYVYSSPAVWNGRVYFGSYNGSFYAVSARNRRDRLALLDRRRDRGSSVDRGRRRLLQQPPAPDLQPGRALRPAGLPLPRRRLRAGLGQRAAAPFARLLAAVRRRAQKPMKRVLIGVGVALLVIVGALVGVGLYREHQGRDVRGSSTEEFSTTQQQPVARPPTAKIRWPMYRFDEARQGDAPKMLVKPPYRPLWFFRAGSLVEFPPAVAYGKLYFANADGVLFAVDISKVRDRLGLPRTPVHGGNARDRRAQHLHDLPEQATVQREPLRDRRPGRRAQRRHGQGQVEGHDRAKRVVAARGRRRRLCR